jgi:ABC-type nickel/cobalt efflux system permease component RcnA
MSRIARAAAALTLALAWLAAFPAVAVAHPLGNFTVNHLSLVTVERDAVRVRYVLDLAEIPTLQEMNAGTAGTLAERVAPSISVEVAGRRVPLRVESARTDRIAGQAGLDTMRVVIELATAGALADGATIVYRDLTFPGRVGWHDVVLRGAIAGASVGADDLTDELRAYPADAAIAPPDRIEATARVALGANVGGEAASAGGATRFAIDASVDRLTALLRGGNADLAALAAALVVATILGALHALGPGHGKTVVAAYLVGSKGTAKDAAILGGTVTLTHTLGVYALGLVTLVAAQLLVPESVYPVLGVLSGVMVTVTGAILLRARLRRRAAEHAHSHGHEHGDGPGQHSHEGRVGMRGLLALGVSGGLLPCPTALVILLAAVSFHNVLLGMALVAAFSVGLAAVLTGIGLALVWGRGMLRRNSGALAIARSRLVGLGARYLPAASAGVITLAGVVLTVRSILGSS